MISNWTSRRTIQLVIVLIITNRPRASRSSDFEIREIKFDVTWSYVKRQTAKMTFEFVFFSSNPLLNHINLEKCLLLFATNTNVFTLLFKELNTEGKRFIFAVCRLTYDHVMSNLISLLLARLLPELYSARSNYYYLLLFLLFCYYSIQYVTFTHFFLFMGLSYFTN